MSPHERRVVAFLSRPASYPHPVEAVERRETHVSHVFLAGRFAYKLKKPVTFPFLDASTLARRKRFCQLELSLNRRLAPSVYLGLVPLVETRRGLRFGGAGRVIEWVVQMRRLPEERMLDHLVARRRVSRREMAQVADRLITFFRRAARGWAIDRYGTVESVRALLLGNLEECRPFVGRLCSEADRRFLEFAYRQFLTLHEDVLVRRLRERRIMDGHGDLRCENICLMTPDQARRLGLADPVAIFDCVEFQPAFRCGDVVNDFSFLVMDLEFRGRQDLADALVERYRRQVQDPTLDLVLPIYKCHRSLVRAKVRGLAWLQHPRTAQGRRVKALARRHFRLARRYAQQVARPRLIVVGGLIGSGKSTLAQSLAEALGATWLRTDEIRRREFTHLRRPVQGFADGLYAPSVSEIVYQRLLRRAKVLVRRGESVVCDGTFSRAEGRKALRRIARRSGASFHFVECVVPKAVALRRVATRYEAKTDLSEARPAHYDRLRAGFEPVQGWPAKDWTRLSDNRPAQATHQAALHALQRAWACPPQAMRGRRAAVARSTSERPLFLLES